MRFGEKRREALMRRFRIDHHAAAVDAVPLLHRDLYSARKWNGIYGSRIMVNPETARKSFPSLFTEPHSIAEFEDFVGFYGNGW